MKALILGAGMQGVACAYDMIQATDVESVTLADTNEDALKAAVSKLNSPKIQTLKLDIRDHAAVVKAMTPVDVTVSAVPYFFNEALTRAAIEAKSHMVDMGGNTDVVFKQMAQSEAAQAAGVTIVPDMGLAPGYANLLAAELIERLDTVDTVEVRVGGLPQNPTPPLDYQLFFSVEGLINEYLGDCHILADGKPAYVKSLEDLETLTFAAPLGVCEAFNTLGGTSTMPWTYEGRVKTYNYKTVRYPGHCEKLRLLEDLGFFETTPVTTRDGATAVPRLVTSMLFDQKLRRDNPRDYVVIRVRACGSLGGEPTEIQLDVLDRYDESTGYTAMMRTTAFPVSIVAQMLGRKSIQQPGVFPPERVVPVGEVRREMDKRGIPTQETQKAISRC